VADFFAVGLIAGGMLLCWLYAVAIDRNMRDDPGARAAKP